LGLYFLYLLVLNTLFGITNSWYLVEKNEILLVFIISIAVAFGLFLLVLRYMVLQPTILIERFKLTSHFEEESLQISSDKTSMIQIALIILGGLTLLDGIPGFARTFISMMRDELFFNESPHLPDLIQNFVRMVIGFLLVSRSQGIAKWIEQKAIIQKETLD
jgi:hypothetical protein